MLPSLARQRQDKFYWNREKRFDHALMWPFQWSASGTDALQLLESEADADAHFDLLKTL